jgi:hypothetical protein
MADSKRPESATPEDSSAPKAGARPEGTIEFPKPTPDQQDYLKSVKQSEGSYDPNVVVGGPRQKPS